jgi:hypothetical protein
VSMAASTQVWPLEDLARRLCHALSIAKKAVELLVPDGFTDPQEPANSVRAEKVVSETALLLFVASKVTGQPEVSALVHSIAGQLIPHARSRRVLLNICLEPASALDYAFAHIFLTQLGYRDRDADALLRESLTSQGPARERPPHRMLEQQWIEDLFDNSMGNPKSGSRPPSLATRSSLAAPMDLFNGSRDDIYAFTHALMYSSRFNASPPPLPRPRAEILAEAEAALARCLDDEDYDLGGELLLAWPLTGASWSAGATFGFHVLLDVEEQAGFLPTPNTRSDRANSLQGADRSRYLLATAYHTAYVMGLLCATALRAGRTPPAKIPDRKTACGAAAPILGTLDADARPTHWRNALRNLTPQKQDSLAGLLLQIALHRKIAKREFQDVPSLLQHGSVFGLIDSPATRQAAELMQRLALLAQMNDERSRHSGAIRQQSVLNHRSAASRPRPRL